MTDLDAMPWFPEDTAPVIETPRKHRHGLVSATPPDPVRQRRNRLNRQRGKATSAELAAYLGWQNVEGMLWSHDVQGPHGRLQSKRDATGRSASMILRLIEGIPPGDYLRGAFIVKPLQRLATGTVTLLLSECVGEWGWSLPPAAVLVNADGTPLLSLSLAAFRELVTP